MFVYCRSLSFSVTHTRLLFSLSFNVVPFQTHSLSFSISYVCFSVAHFLVMFFIFCYGPSLSVSKTLSFVLHFRFLPLIFIYCRLASESVAHFRFLSFTLVSVTFIYCYLFPFCHSLSFNLIWSQLSIFTYCSLLLLCRSLSSFWFTHFLWLGHYSGRRDGPPSPYLSVTFLHCRLASLTFITITLVHHHLLSVARFRFASLSLSLTFI